MCLMVNQWVNVGGLHRLYALQLSQQVGTKNLTQAVKCWNYSACMHLKLTQGVSIDDYSARIDLAFTEEVIA